jgi:hypothetical protein
VRSFFIFFFFFWAIFANFPTQNPFQKFAKPGYPLQSFFFSHRKFRTHHLAHSYKRKKDFHCYPYCEISSIITIFVNIKHSSSNNQQKMKVIQIKAKDFFELIKLKDTSMWEIFSQMIDGEEKEIIFLDEEEKILFNYILPQNLEKLEEDRKTFAKEYAEKMSGRI